MIKANDPFEEDISELQAGIRILKNEVCFDGTWWISSARGGRGEVGT